MWVNIDGTIVLWPCFITLGFLERIFIENSSSKRLVINAKKSAQTSHSVIIFCLEQLFGCFYQLGLHIKIEFLWHNMHFYANLIFKMSTFTQQQKIWHPKAVVRTNFGIKSKLVGVLGFGRIRKHWPQKPELFFLASRLGAETKNPKTLAMINCRRRKFGFTKMNWQMKIKWKRNLID